MTPDNGSQSEEHGRPMQQVGVLGRTVAEHLAGIERALESFLLEHPDITRDEALRLFRAGGAF